MKTRIIYQSIKYFFDYLFAGFLIIILLPIFAIISLIILIDSKGPVLFVQKRIGKDQIPFVIFKFRTMKTETPNDIPTHKLVNPEEYLTRVGKFLRKTSLDELPQLFNILFGKMSFIGPRPALWNQYDLIRLRENHKIHQLKPGITGWAQVMGRDELPIEEKVKLDFYYLKYLNLFLDLKIIFKTIIVVLKKKGNVEGGTSSLGIKEEKQ